MSAPKRTYKIAAIPADGVGKEVVAAGRDVLDALAAALERRLRLRLDEFPGAASTTPRTGRMMAEDGLETLKRLRRHLLRRRRLADRPRPHHACGVCG